jgi:hypothetical protein
MLNSWLVCSNCGKVYDWDFELPFAVNLCPECMEKEILAA